MKKNNDNKLLITFLFLIIIFSVIIMLVNAYQYNNKLKLLNEDLKNCAEAYFTIKYPRSNCINNPTCQGLNYTTDCRYHRDYDLETYNSYIENEKNYICNEESGEYLFYFKKDYWCNEDTFCGIYPEGFI